MDPVNRSCIHRFRGMVLLVPWLVGAGLMGVGPARADLSLRWGELQRQTNQVTLHPAGGRPQGATVAQRLGPGDRLTTEARAQADVRFNEGSLVRLGEYAQFSFLPAPRRYQLHQGTALVLVPAAQGRSLVVTPNAVTGLQGSAAVVRYVPSRQLTVVLALSHGRRGPLVLTTLRDDREYGLRAGQMAFVNDAGIQVVEFDLQRFYATSDLMAGTALATDPTTAQPADPLTALWQEMAALASSQKPFAETSAVLDPATISADASLGPAPLAAPPSPAGAAGPTAAEQWDEVPPGVVAPLPAGVNSDPAPIGPVTEPAPAQPTPAQPTPGQDAPGQDAPVQPTPGPDAPVQPTPGPDAPAQPTPGPDAPVQPTPSPDAPAQPAPTGPALDSPGGSPAPGPAQPSPGSAETPPSTPTPAPRPGRGPTPPAP